MRSLSIQLLTLFALLPALGFPGEILWGHALAWEAKRRLKR